MAQKIAKKAAGKAKPPVKKSTRARAKAPSARTAASSGSRRGSLVIVESPAKARTIKKYLGSGFRVEASVGHVKDLPKRELGVDIERDFRPAYQVIEGKAKVISNIKKAAEGREKVFLAPDPDREGEAIAWHIAEELRGSGAEIYRVLFNEITKPAVQEALAHPGQLDRKLYEAQQARRVLDRLVGYQISPILWKKVRRGLSAGRVQSVAVRLIVEREREIEAFKAEEYWTVDAKLVGDAQAEFLARLIKIHGRKASIPDRAHADRIVAELRGAPFTVKSVERKERKRNPAPPFTTSSLQMEAARKLRFTAKRTMGLAQKLYEGVDLGQEGPVGLITYMRTDSVRVGNDALREARTVILDRYGAESLPAHAIHYKTKKSAQDAHEAVRPTLIDHDPERVRPFLDADALALYELIWKRFLASQMNPAIYDATTVDIESGRNTLRATGSILKAPGFMTLYLEGTDEEENGNGAAAEVGGERLLPELRQGESLRLLDLLSEQHFTKPPARFGEATLVKELEQKGIGRPSTYASILSTIVDKKYVDKEEGRFRPTHLGLLVNDLLVKNFPQVMDVEFTAQMEESLDGVEEGRLNWVETLRAFYGDFRQALTKAKHEMRNVKEEVIKAGITCERCGKDMLVKWGKNGEFLACQGYPDCRNTREFVRVNGTVTPVEHKVEEGDSCEKCGSAMVRKRGRFGEFLACSAYPDCRNTRPIGGRPDPMAAEPTGEKCDKCDGDMMLKMSRFGSRFYGCGNYPKCRNVKPLGTGVACPEPGCGGEIVQRSSRKGRVFYGCGRYPDCNFVLWDKPVATPCPTCDSPLCVEKYSKKTGRMLRCANKECSFSRPLEEEAATAG